jgi:aryl-alcohol dehydrogenase-like predicted oxidoreductase
MPGRGAGRPGNDPDMNPRPLGRSGLLVAPLAFGGNVFGWTADEATSFRLLDAFVDAGFNLIDTADVYSSWAPGNRGGESETIIGKWLARTGKRNRVVIATKVGYDRKDAGGGLSRAHILRNVEASLGRLRTDRIDLYQSHVEDPATPHEETLAAYAGLIEAGKVRAIGASNFRPATLRDALAVSKRLGLPRYETLQPLYNLYDREGFEAELGPLCREEGIGVIPFFALAAGFLTGKYRTQADLAQSARGQRAKNYLNERGLRIVAALEAVAARLGATPGKVAVAWLMAQPGITAPIASGRTVEQVRDLAGAAHLELDAAAMQALEAASA